MSRAAHKRVVPISSNPLYTSDDLQRVVPSYARAAHVAGHIYLRPRSNLKSLTHAQENSLQQLALDYGFDVTRRDHNDGQIKPGMGYRLYRLNPALGDSVPVDTAAIASAFTSNLTLTTDPAFEHGDAETRAALITAHQAKGAVAPAPPPIANPAHRFSGYTKAEAESRARKMSADERKLRRLGSPGNYASIRVVKEFEGPGRSSDRYAIEVEPVSYSGIHPNPEPGDAPATSPALATAMGGGQPLAPPPTGAGRGTSTSTSTDVRSPTSTDVRSPTRTATSTEAYTAGNVTVTGGAGAGANTRVIIRRNPRRDDTPYAKYNYISNPDTEAAANEMFETFHGYPPTHVTEIEETLHYDENLAPLGTLVSLTVETESNYSCTVKFPRHGSRGQVNLSSSADGSSMYLVGGDQELDLRALHLDGSKWRKDVMAVGRVKKLEYFTTKEQDGMTPTLYFHKSREGLTADGTKHTIVADVDPVLLYDTKSKLISLAGGQYTVESVGIVG